MILMKFKQMITTIMHNHSILMNKQRKFRKNKIRTIKTQCNYEKSKKYNNNWQQEDMENGKARG